MNKKEIRRHRRALTITVFFVHIFHHIYFSSYFYHNTIIAVSGRFFPNVGGGICKNEIHTAIFGND